MTRTGRGETCSNCGAKARVVRGTYPFKESGLKNVVLEGIHLIKCRKCGNVDPIIPSLNGLMDTIALALVAKPYRLCGEEIRYLRKYLRMTGEEFARTLGVDKTNLSKWENNADPVGPQSDRLIRAVVALKGERLKGRINDIVAEFAAINKQTRRLPIEIDPREQTYQYA